MIPRSWGSRLSISLLLINLAAIMEKADESLLPAVYKEVAQTFHATPSELGALTFIRALVQAIFSPAAGILSMRYNRPAVIGLGTIFWAFSTAAVAFSQNFSQCAWSRAVNGIGLAIVIPATQSFIADSYLDGGRGVAFGWLNLVGSLGGIGGSMAATIMAGYEIAGMPGWRFAFILMALLSAFIGWLVHQFVIDPRGGSSLPSSMLRSEKEMKALPNIWRDSFSAINNIVRVRTFQLIVLQGLVGSFPWTAMVFFTMWFQLIGFGHKGAAMLVGLFSMGNAFGALLGGWIGDQAARRYPNSGRIMCAQFSSFMGIPFSWLLLHGLPQEPGLWYAFAVTLVCMGLIISWNQACANNPMFADVVPPKHRTMIYAFDRAFEGAFSAMAAPLVGILAEQVYGYRRGVIITEVGSREEAIALSRGLFAMMAIPFGICCLSYTPLYRTYKLDRLRPMGAQHQSDFESSEKMTDQEG
ncbi:uncharacterized protein LOC9644682 [Selaginella moellendorffii]|uniref:uncharacterized protein LOC9663095 n=1 Tax=Selaginella moellendorffii TaxID=88036 RepID=UPI000D1D0141|nr:uncharacterized protein LOC9663095 [Selaginella moellendorffii]XP_024544896.1 uncharacterized protein LOC9644682 [Selaginella moellendorffii]|eukprot:XP_024525802.1 uncharacterized protein LOC9663095 [Selaginella moellendorffii]